MAAGTLDVEETRKGGALPTIVEQFDHELRRIVPEMLHFFDATVVRKWQENLDFERRILDQQQKYDRSDLDGAAPSQSNRPCVSKENGIKQRATEGEAAPGTQSGLDVLARTVIEPDVIDVDEHMRKIRKVGVLDEGIMMALVLLRTLKEEHWGEFDNPDASDTEQESVDQASQVESTIKSSRTESGPEACTPFMEMVEHMMSGKRITLSTNECNTLLARIALSPELLPDEILSIMMETYLKMNKSDASSSQPDALTFEILILTFCYRFAALPTATDFVHLLRERKVWSPKAFEAAALLCEKRVDHSLAVKLLDDVEQLQDMSGTRFFRSLINVAKADDNRHTALRVLRLALANPESSIDPNLDKLFVNAIQWRTRNKHGKALDNSDYIDAILRMLESNVSLYAPGFTVWRELIMMGANGARRNPGRYRLVDRAFSRLEMYLPRYHPDYKLVKHGLDASRTLRKPALAASVILHAIECIGQSPTASAKNLAVVSPVPGSEILKAMEICVQWNDASSCGKILAAVDSISLPEPLLKPIYFLGVLGYARRGNSEEAERILFDMQQRGMALEDKFYGALMLCYAMSKQIELAQYLMRSIESGDMGVEVGPAIYDGYVLACVMCQNWDDIVAVFERMKAAGLHPPTASSCHGILLAGYRQGKSADESKALLDDLLEAGALFNREVALLSIKILVPHLCLDGTTISTIRTKLRSNLPKDDEMAKGAIVQLIRSLRIAEMEEERGLPSTSLTKAGSETWTAVMKDLLHVMNVEKRTSESLSLSQY